MLITEDSLLQIIEDTWSSTLGLHVDRQAPSEPLAGDALTVSTRITGEWSGEVQLDCPLPLARLIAAATFQVEAESATHEQIVDALCELVHIVGGNLKPLLPQPVQVSLPEITTAMRERHAPPPASQINRLTLTAAGQSFVMTLRGSVATPRKAA